MKIIPSGIANKLGHQLLVARKNSPKVMFIAGIGGVIVSTVLACRATLKLDQIVDTLEDDVRAIKADSSEELTREDRKDLVKVYAHGTADIVRLYGPAVIVGTASLACLVASHVTLTHRNTNVTAAYVGLQSTFDAYRERVKKEIGEEKERDIRHGITTQTIDVDGKKMKVKVNNPDGLSEYYRVFDETSTEFQIEPEYNRTYILGQQSYLNDLLTVRGHVFLNEVYDALGLPRSPAGQVVGWVKAGNLGDGFIDFGMYQVANEKHLNHGENYFVLDFNVDGVIYDLI